MRTIFIALSLALASCASIPQQISEIPATCAQNIVMDDKAMASLEVAYNVPAHAYFTADTNGVLSAEVKAKVKPLLIDAHAWLVKARAAYDAKNAIEFACAYAGVERNATSANTLLRR